MTEEIDEISDERVQDIYKWAKLGQFPSERLKPSELVAIIERMRIAEEAFGDVMYQEFNGDDEHTLNFLDSARNALRAEKKIR